MNINVVFNFIGGLLQLLSALMCVPLACSIIYGEEDAASFLLSMAITFFLGLFLRWRTRAYRESEIGVRESFGIVGFGWLIVVILGALPYLFAGTFGSFWDALFESVSGFTTTGSSVLTDIESQSNGILFWRGFTQWLGGMGIIVMVIAILPVLNMGGMKLMGLEWSGASNSEQLKPRIISTAKTLWSVYIILSVAEVACLLLAGMSLFDSLCHMFTTVATGGFSTRNISVKAFHSPAIESIITVFMFLAGINFVLNYHILRGNFRKVFSNPEFKMYVSVMSVAALVVTLNLWGREYQSVFESIRHAVFQVVSIGTSTGFTSTDFDRWPSFSRGVLVILMLIGGCVGSTAGGIKQFRILILLKKGYIEIYHLLYPKAVVPVRLGDEPVPPQIISQVAGFFFLYLLIVACASLFMMGLGIDIVTSVSSVIASIGAIGPGLNLVGATRNYAWVPVPGKFILTFCMLLGRLELYALLLFFVPAMWKE